ncbi:MAG: WD40 repeat domain-containing protein [Planctomycetaceae bacterium]
MRLNKRLSLTHGNSVYWAAFSRKGDQLATASLDNTVRLWSLPDGKHVGTLKGHGDGVAYVGYLEDGRIVTASLDKTLKVWPAEGGAALISCSGHQDYLACGASAKTGSLLASGGFDKTVRLWDGNSGNQLAVLSGHEATVQAVAISGSGTLLASGGDDRSVRLWSTESTSLLKTLIGHTKAVEGLAFAPDDAFLASAGADGAVKLWKTDGQLIASLDSPDARLKSWGYRRAVSGSSPAPPTAPSACGIWRRAHSRRRCQRTGTPFTASRSARTANSSHRPASTGQFTCGKCWSRRVGCAHHSRQVDAQCWWEKPTLLGSNGR